MSYGPSRRNFLASIPPVTKNLVLINLLLFVPMLINQEFMIEHFALFVPASPFFKPWQYLTYMFMHGGVAHVLLNMYTLLIFGMVLERTIGSKKFILLYFVAGLGAAALHTGVLYCQMAAVSSSDPSSVSKVVDILRTPTVGASGAVYGVLLAYALLYPDSVMTLLFPPVSLKAKWMVLVFAGIELVTGVFSIGGGIAHFAHLGGMLFGWLMIVIWRKRGTLFRYDEWI